MALDALGTPSDSNRSLSRAELILLCLLVIALPLVEAPKNILSAILVLTWLIGCARRGNWGELKRSWDYIFLALIASAIVAVAFCSPLPPQWREVSDVIRYLSLGWIIARSQASEKQLGQVLACAVFSTGVGLAHGWWAWKIAARTSWLQLNSVGHVSHSALYFSGIALSLLATTLAYWQRIGVRSRYVVAMMNLGALALLLTWESRGALVTYLVGSLVFCLYFARQHNVRILLASSLIAVFAGSVLWLNPYLVEKTHSQIMQAGGPTSSYRLELGHTALEAFTHRPLTGVGPANFRYVDRALVERWHINRHEHFVPERFFYGSHAHSLYFNTLAERGLVGLCALAFLFSGWTYALVIMRPAATGHPLLWAAWGAGIAGWALVFVGGLFNTTLHHEHGMLAMLLLGTMLSAQHSKAGTVSA